MSGSEALPALETTRFESCTPGSSLHAMPEAVTALPTSNLWLVCPFHDRDSSKSGREHRLRSVPKLCQSVGSANRGIDPRSQAPIGPRRIRMNREKNP